MKTGIVPNAGPALAGLRRTISSLKPPVSFFSGLTLNRAMAPDNLIFFQQTDTAAFKPEGVTDNHHHRFELVTVLEKAGPVRIGETSYLLEPGEAALIFPNQFHHYMDVEPGPMKWLFITFELARFDEIEPLKNAPRTLSAHDLALLHKTLEEYVHPAGREPDCGEISHSLSRLLRGMTAAPMIPAERRNIHSTDAARDVVLEKINRHVRTHLSEALTLGALAEALGYSASHLRTVFRTRLGVSLGRYIRESRLAEAAKLLQSSDLPIADVARQSGFDSAFSFSRAFKSAYGMPPKAYSKRLRERPSA